MSLITSNPFSGILLLRSLSLYDKTVSSDYRITSGDFKVDLCMFYNCSINLESGNIFEAKNSVFHKIDSITLESFEVTITKSCFLDGKNGLAIVCLARKSSNYSNIAISNYPLGSSYLMYTSGVWQVYHGDYSHHSINASDSSSCIYTQYPAFSETKYITLLRCIGSKGLSYGGFRFEGNHQNCNIINSTISQGFLATTYCSTTVSGYIFKNSGNIICGKFFADDNSCSITIKNSVFDRPVIDGTVTSTKQNCL